MGEEDIYTHTQPGLCAEPDWVVPGGRQSAVVQLVYSVYTYTGSGHVTDPDGSMSYRC